MAAVQLLLKVAVIKCEAHIRADDSISLGNALADRYAKDVIHSYEPITALPTFLLTDLQVDLDIFFSPAGKLASYVLLDHKGSCLWDRWYMETKTQTGCSSDIISFFVCFEPWALPCLNRRDESGGSQRLVGSRFFCICC